MKLNLSPEQLIFLEYDKHGFGVSRKEYGELHSILLYLYDRNNPSPDQEILELLKDPTNIWMQQAIIQGKELLARKDFPWRYVGHLINWSQLEDTETAVRTYLEHMFELIEENLPRKSAE